MPNLQDLHSLAVIGALVLQIVLILRTRSAIEGKQENQLETGQREIGKLELKLDKVIDRLDSLERKVAAYTGDGNGYH